MEIKTYLNPKWWLIVFGAIFLVLGAGNYMTAEDAAKTAYPDPTDRDVFYEHTFGLFSMVTKPKGTDRTSPSECVQVKIGTPAF